MILDYKDIAKHGIIKDVPAHTLPMGAWSDGSNVRFQNGKIKKFTGHSQVFGTATVAPHWMMPIPQAAAYYWMYAGTAKVYVTDGTTHFNITRQTASVDVDYSPTDNIKWNGGVLGGVPVINNGTDDPQVWLPSTTGTKLQSLKYDASNDWAAMSYTARVIRPFKSFLIALDVNKAGQRYPYMVKWSHPAEPGAEPESWDESDTSNLAGERNLARHPGFVIDGLPLGDTFIIYKEGSTWGMQSVGGNSVFKTYPIFEDQGILSRECVVELNKKHVVLTAENLYLHDTQTSKGILDDRWEKWYQDNLDPTNYQQSYVVRNLRESEIWACIPTTGALYPDKAIVWNYRDNAISIRDIPNAPHIAYGAISENQTTATDDIEGTIDAYVGVYDEVVFNPTTSRMLIANTNFFKSESTNQFDGTSMTSFVERKGIDFGKPEERKYIRNLFLQMEGSDNVNVYLGSHDRANETPTYKDAVVFNPATDREVNVEADGYYAAIKIETTGDVDWAATGIQFDIDGSGFN